MHYPVLNTGHGRGGDCFKIVEESVIPGSMTVFCEMGLTKSPVRDRQGGPVSVAVSTGRGMHCPSRVRDCLQKLPSPALPLTPPAVMSLERGPKTSVR